MDSNISRKCFHMFPIPVAKSSYSSSPIPPPPTFSANDMVHLVTEKTEVNGRESSSCCYSVYTRTCTQTHPSPLLPKALDTFFPVLRVPSSQNFLLVLRIASYSLLGVLNGLNLPLSPSPPHSPPPSIFLLFQLLPLPSLFFLMASWLPESPHTSSPLSLCIHNCSLARPLPLPPTRCSVARALSRPCVIGSACSISY